MQVTMDLVTQTLLWDDFRNVMLLGDFLVYLTAKTFEGSGAESNYPRVHQPDANCRTGPQEDT